MKKSLSVFMIFVLVTAALLATGQKEQVQVQETEKVGDGWFHKYETPITLSGNRITSSSTDFTENSYTDWAERTLGINYELKTAQALQGEYSSLSYAVASIEQSLVVGRQSVSPAIPQLKVRTAARAGVGLGVEPATGRVFKFLAAFRTHGKNSHGGIGSIVR